MQVEFPRNDKALGRDGEALAADFLRGLGYRIIEKNYRCRQGEVDLIVAKAGTLTFVEVKTRKSVDAVSPRELVTRPKQRHISKAAQHFLASRRMTEVNADFGVLILDLSTGNPRFEWIPQAFDLAWGY